jgi:hypothetical protein
MAPEKIAGMKAWRKLALIASSHGGSIHLLK